MPWKDIFHTRTFVYFIFHHALTQRILYIIEMSLLSYKFQSSSGSLIWTLHKPAEWRKAMLRQRLTIPGREHNIEWKGLCRNFRDGKKRNIALSVEKIDRPSISRVWDIRQSECPFSMKRTDAMFLWKLARGRGAAKTHFDRLILIVEWWRETIPRSIRTGRILPPSGITPC